MLVIKRDGRIEPFNESKIKTAIEKASIPVGKLKPSQISSLVKEIKEKVLNTERDLDTNISVNTIHDITEDVLISKYPEVAKEYIFYRRKREEEHNSLFVPREYIKPYDYPELLDYMNAIRHSYWIHTEFNFSSDINDMRINLSDHEKLVVERCMLAIAQVEVKVKAFWAKIHEVLPKPEIAMVGMTFAESEVRHLEAYSFLLELLGLNDKFKDLMDEKIFKTRYEYLSGLKMDTDNIIEDIMIFSLLVEYISLFSQFYIVTSFNKHKNVLSGVSNVIEATSKEEQIHGMFGSHLCNIFNKTNPDKYEFALAKARALIKNFISVEGRLINWIFDGKDLDFLTIDEVKNFVNFRVNKAFDMLDNKKRLKEFAVDEKYLPNFEWFEVEMTATKDIDFFNKRSVNYSKKNRQFDTNELFGD